MQTIKVFHAKNRETLLLNVSHLNFVSIDTTSEELFTITANYSSYDNFKKNDSFKQCQYSFEKYSELVVKQFLKSLLDFKEKNKEPNNMFFKYYLGTELLLEFEIPAKFFIELEKKIK